MSGTEQAILDDVLAACKRMFAHLDRSHEQAGHLLPMTPERVPRLDDQEIDRLDLYLGRFGKLQDFMTTRLFRALARASLEDTDADISILDTLSRMEKFGVLDDTDAWLKARMLCNAFAHEYLTDTAAIADNINTAWSLYPLLARTYANAEAFRRTHIPPAQGDRSSQ